MKTGSKSIPYFSGTRASLATSQGSELMPMGENGNGTFFGTCAYTVALDQKNKRRNKMTGSLSIAFRRHRQNGNSREPCIFESIYFLTIAGLLHSALGCQSSKTRKRTSHRGGAGREKKSIFPDPH